MSSQLAFDSAMSMARQSLCRFAALTFADPRGGSWDALHALRDDPILNGAAALMRESPQTQGGELGPGERPLRDLLPQGVLDHMASSRAAHNAEYEDVFGLLASRGCPPYETEFIGDKLSYQRAHALADVSGFYRAFGLTLSDARRERHDHIALELEFMAFLIDLERRAAEGGTSGEVRRKTCFAAQARFLKEHLAWWAAPFARLLSWENPGGFYDAAATFLAALIPAERALLGVAVQRRPGAPTAAEGAGSCDACQAFA